MILVRNIFHLKFGKAKEAKALIDENKKLMAKYGMATENTRFLTDVTGPFYTLVMEVEADDLSAYEKSSTEAMQSAEFGKWYEKFTPLVESGEREIFHVLD